MSLPVWLCERVCVFITVYVFIREGRRERKTQNPSCLCTFNLKGSRGEGCGLHWDGQLVLIWAGDTKG